MKKRIFMSAVGALSASAVVAYLLSDEEKRKKMMNTIETVKDKITDLNSNDKPTTLEAAGIPDQTQHTDETLAENADMVSEGSQYGVSYFNEKMEEENSNDPK